MPSWRGLQPWLTGRGRGLPLADCGPDTHPITAAYATRGAARQGRAAPRQHALPPVMPRCGRQCRGLGHVLGPLVCPPERPWGARGAQGRPLAQAAHASWHGAPPRGEDHRARRDSPRMAARTVHPRSVHPSRQLTPGKAGRHGPRVHADAPTLAPRGPGKRHGPAPWAACPG
jgi:hypothetical protein